MKIMKNGVEFWGDLAGANSCRRRLEFVYE